MLYFHKHNQNICMIPTQIQTQHKPNTNTNPTQTQPNTNTKKRDSISQMYEITVWFSGTLGTPISPYA